MNTASTSVRKNRTHRFNLLHAIAIVAIVALAMPGRAGDSRAIKTRVAPVYPEIAKRMRISGEVRLLVSVDAAGDVKDVKSLEGNHMLAVAAEEAVRKWKFVSGDGDAQVTITLTFALSD